MEKKKITKKELIALARLKLNEMNEKEIESFIQSLKSPSPSK